MARKTFRNVITSQDLLEQVNPENKRLVEKFLRHKSNSLSPNSIIVYGSNLDIFFVWNLEHNGNKLFTDIKKLEFSDFFSYATEELKIGSSRINNLRSTLSSFSTFIEKFFDEEYPNFRNVILTIIDSAPKEFRREKTVLTDEQVESLLKHLEETDSQKACWLALAITSGARFSELLRWEVDLIDENRTAFGDIFLETTRPIKTKGRGKQGKMIHKYILKDTFMPYYKKWLFERGRALKENNQSHKKLFIKADGSPATSASIKAWMPKFTEFLGVTFYAHACRHYLTTLLSRKNIPASFIKELFGWENLDMVSHYDDSSFTEKYIPELENLKM